MKVWILSRWEGDYDVYLGAYSTRDKAVGASITDFKEVTYRTQQYNLFVTDLDAQPREVESETITHRKG